MGELKRPKGVEDWGVMNWMLCFAEEGEQSVNKMLWIEKFERQYKHCNNTNNWNMQYKYENVIKMKKKNSNKEQKWEIECI